MVRRRAFLTSVGALVTLGALETVSARNRSSELSTEEVGEAFYEGMLENGVDGARRALESLGLDPAVEATQDFQMTSDEESISMGEDTGDDGEVSPQYSYGDPKHSDSELVVGVSNAPGHDDVWVAVGMTLDGCKTTVRNSWWCPDAIGIGYAPSDWAPMGEPAVHAGRQHEARFTTDDVSDDALAGTVNINGPDLIDPITCDVLPTAGVNLTGRFRLRDGREPSTVWGSYTHTIGAPTSTIKGISGGYGGLGVDLTLDASTVWSIAHPSDPEDNI